MKPRPTLADYMIIAISPALIMALVGSLVFFLIELFYQGQYQTRLQWVFACFVMAAVLIGRLSIEEGRGRAAMYALPLAAVTLLALFRFVEYQGIAARISAIINIGLVGLIWWCADRLTWDCTVIDEQQDASGEGLLQTVGMDDSPSQAAGASPDLDGTTGAEPSSEPPRTWLQRIAAARNKKHAPGVWVVYFSMAALPIFGIGQGFMFGQSDEDRRFVFKLLFVYVAAALGLLLTTSFLGLRRYLRQRRLEMPTSMAGTWLGTGAVMIAGLLVFCMLLPRRNAEYSLGDLPAFAGAPDDVPTNPHGFGKDGPEGKDPRVTVDRPDTPNKGGEPGDDDGPGDEPSENGKGDPKPGDAGKEPGENPGKSNDGGDDKKSPDEGGEKKGGEKNDGGDKDGGDKKDAPQEKQPPSDAQSPEGKPDEQPKGKQDKGKSDKPDDKPADPADGNKSDGDKGKQEPNSKQDDKGGKSEEPKNQSPKNEPPKKQTDDKPKQKQSQKFDPAKLAKQLGGGIGTLLKLLYWAIVIAIVAWFLWRYWAQVREAVRGFIQSLREFWARLFGGSATPAAEAATEPVASAPPPPPFSSFADPFQSGLASRMPLDQLVKYSFEAFEAWARERGFTRRRDETPHEFAEHVAQSGAGVSQEAIRLAELYSRAAYSRDAMPQASGQYLQQLWRQLTAAM